MPLDHGHNAKPAPPSRPAGETEKVRVFPRVANEQEKPAEKSRENSAHAHRNQYAPVPFHVLIGASALAIAILFVLFNAPEWLRGGKTSTYQTAVAVVSGIALVALLRPLRPLWAFVRGIMILCGVLVAGILGALFGPEKIMLNIPGVEAGLELVRPGTTSPTVIIALAVLVGFLVLVVAAVILIAKWMEVLADRDR